MLLRGDAEVARLSSTDFAERFLPSRVGSVDARDRPLWTFARC